MKEFGIMSSS